MQVVKLKKRESIENYSRIQKKDEELTPQMWNPDLGELKKQEEMTQQIGEKQQIQQKHGGSVKKKIVPTKINKSDIRILLHFC